MRTVTCDSPQDRFLWRRFYEGNRGDVMGPNMWPLSPVFTQGCLPPMWMDLMQELVDRGKAPTPMQAGARPELLRWKHRAYGQGVGKTMAILKEWSADLDLRLKKVRRPS